MRLYAVIFVDGPSTRNEVSEHLISDEEVSKIICLLDIQLFSTYSYCSIILLYYYTIQEKVSLIVNCETS